MTTLSFDHKEMCTLMAALRVYEASRKEAAKQAEDEYGCMQWAVKFMQQAWDADYLYCRLFNAESHVDA